MGFVVWPMVELEADDALASAARIASEDRRVEKVCIWTVDKDLAQCVRGDRVVQMDRRANTIRDAQGVREKFGVEPVLIPDFWPWSATPRMAIRELRDQAVTAVRLWQYGAIENLPPGARQPRARALFKLATLGMTAAVPRRGPAAMARPRKRSLPAWASAGRAAAHRRAALKAKQRWRFGAPQGSAFSRTAGRNPASCRSRASLNCRLGVSEIPRRISFREYRHAFSSPLSSALRLAASLLSRAQPAGTASPSRPLRGRGGATPSARPRVGPGRRGKGPGEDAVVLRRRGFDVPSQHADRHRARCAA